MLYEKSALIVIYLGLFLGVCILPFALQLRQPKPVKETPITKLTLLAMLCATALALLLVRGVPALTSPLVLSLAFVIPLLGQGWGTALGGLASLALFAAVTWWAPDMQIGLERAAAFVILGTLAAALPRLSLQRLVISPVVVVGLVSILGIAQALLTGAFGESIAFGALWHHWGAYVAPAESLVAGAIPFLDFPVQYGLGPTLLVAGLCSQGCWIGTYFAGAASNLFYLLAMIGCVLLLVRQVSPGRAILALLSMACAVLLWTGYPPDFLGDLATPSVGGLRFLPLAAMVFFIIWSEENSRKNDAVGHALWFLGLVWSPESCFHVTTVWWSYLGLREAQDKNLTRISLVMLAAVKGAGVALVALLLGFVVLVLIFRLIFGNWPSLDGYVAYVSNPPGILPVNLRGPVWLMLFGVLAGVMSMLMADDVRKLRVSFACLVAMLAACSYYLGRSHDNNVLNLFPFLVLVLTGWLRTADLGPTEGFARLVLAGTVAWSVTFGVASWTTAWQKGEAATLGPTLMLERMRLASPDSVALLNASLATQPNPFTPVEDAGSAFAWLREINAGPPVWVNPAMLLPRDMPGPHWTGVNNLADYALLPIPVIERYIKRGAETFHRSGWLLVDRKQPSPWLDYFEIAYKVTEERNFGGYTAYKLTPR
jgi:hypothetical protein